MRFSPRPAHSEDAMVASAGTPLYRGTIGLNNKLDPERIFHGSKERPNIIELAIAKDVSIDDSGMVQMRKGIVLGVAGSYHSLFCDDGGDCFVVRENTTDATIHKVTISGTTVSLSSAIVSGLAKGQRVAFVQANDLTMWGNGSVCGIIQSGINGTWSVDAYNGPDQNVSFLSIVPVANHLGYDRAGTLAIARANVIFFNYLAFVFGLFSSGRGWVQFPTNVRMVKSVESGWFVSDQKRTYFERGINWSDINERVVAEYPAHEWSCAHELIAATDLELDMDGSCAIWSSPLGIVAGLPTGSIINLTKEKIKYPTAYDRAACLIYDNRKIINTVY